MLMAEVTEHFLHGTALSPVPSSSQPPTPADFLARPSQSNVTAASGGCTAEAAGCRTGDRFGASNRNIG